MTKSKKQIDISYLARISKLDLNEEEKLSLLNDLEDTLKHIQILDQIDTSKIEPTYQITGLSNKLREDQVKVSLDQDKALSSTENIFNGYFKTGLILNKQN